MNGLDGFLAGGEFFYGMALKGISLAYEKGLLKIHRLPVPVVSVGNLTWGGTGKTPMVIRLAKAFREKGRSVAILTRGYGGGDEARLLMKELAPTPVLVGPDRVSLGIRAIREFKAELLLLDDGYQQWRLKKDLEILMVDATAPFGNGHLIPRGSLREPLKAAGRADLIVVTKAELNPKGLQKVEESLRRLNSKAPIFFARTRPTALKAWPEEKPLAFHQLRGKRVATLAGIAHPEQFEATVENCGAQSLLRYRVTDHHPYTMGEMIRFFSRCERHGIQWLVTTSKDASRIPTALVEYLKRSLKKVELLVLEVTLEFEPDESELHHRIDSLLAR